MGDFVLRWIATGTDPMVQLLLIQQMSREGSLAYGLNDGSHGDGVQQAYPKGVHWLITTVLGPGVDGDLSSAVAYQYFTRTFGAFVWFGIALLLLVVGGLFLACRDRWSLHPSTSALAMIALVLVIVVSRQFGYVAVTQGGVGALAAVCAYLAFWWALISGARLRAILAVAVITVIVVSNTWQPLLLIVVVTVAFALTPRLGEVVTGIRDATLRRSAIVGVVVGGTVVVLFAMIPVTSLVMSSGSSVASIPGVMPAPSLPLALISVLTLAWAIYRCGRQRADRALALAGVGLVLGGISLWLAMAYAGHSGPAAYYPSKVAWFIVTFSLPLACFATAVAVRWTWLRAPALSRTLQRFWSHGWARLLSTCAAVLMLAVALPWVLAFPPMLPAAALGLYPAGPPATVGLLDAPERGEFVPYRIGPQWDPSGMSDKIAAQTLRFRFGVPWSPLNRAVTPCVLIRLARPAILLTTLDANGVARSLRASGCDVSGYTVRMVR